MRSRWFHAPTLHTHLSDVEKRATWLELFYDLIFVAAFIQLGDGLSKHTSFGGFAAFAGIFVPLWIVWTGFTFYINRFTIDDFTHRLTVFVQMFAVGAMAVTAPRVLDGEHALFAVTYAIAQALVAIMWFRAWRQVPEARAYSGYWGRVFGVGAVLWGASALAPAEWAYGMWGLAVLFILAAPFSKHSRELQERFPNDAEHLSERYGLLTIIVLGESFVKVLTELNRNAAGPEMILQACTVLLITCCIWWIYFDDVAGSSTKEVPLGWVVWLYAHLPLQIGITATGVAIKKAVHWDLGATAPETYRWLLSGTLGLTLLSVAVIDSVTARRHAELSDSARVNVRAASGVLILLLAPAGGSMTAAMYTVLIATVCVAQVVFDMMMAPFEEIKEDHGAASMSDLAKAAASGDVVAGDRVRRLAIGNSVRKGAPNELRRDVYFWFMEGTWKRFFLSLMFLYLVTNVFFAALYTLQPGCIDGADPKSFGDAFFFSVQTLSTIGYGAMSPDTQYGDILVTAEAAIGLLVVALATGLLFAKASRARSSVLFSNRLVVNKRNGVPTLIFRAGNARGNEIVDATMTVTALMDEITPEGEHTRRLHDLVLLRKTSPLFTLSWTVMHEVDETSPVKNVVWSACGAQVTGIIVTMMGHDGTYGQTVYARHIYYPEDIRVGERFVDVIHQLPDGRIMIDYDVFHDTVAVDETAEPAAPAAPESEGDEA